MGNELLARSWVNLRKLREAIHFYPVSTSSRWFKSAFVVDADRFRRLVELVEERVGGSGEHESIQLTVSLNNGEVAIFDNEDEVLDIQNTEDNEIDRLDINGQVTVQATNEVERSIKVIFDGRRPPSITIGVEGPNIDWVRQSVRAIEHLIHRAFQRSLIHRIKIARGFLLPLLFFLLPVAFFYSTTLSLPSVSIYRMWLTNEDIVYFSGKLKSQDKFTSEDIREMVSRQFRNVAQTDTGGQRLRRTVTSRRFLAIGLPTALVLAGLAYLIARAYPLSVFAWGDAGERYTHLLTIRRYIWNTIIGISVISLLGNLLYVGVFGGGP